MKNAHDVDVAIVGGGPAGTSTALHLVRREGVAPDRVAIVEKAVHPRDKPCAGAVSARGVRALADVGVAIEVPAAPMKGVRVLAAGQEGVHEADMGVVVRRCEFDASLWRAVVRDGVFARDGEPLRQLARDGGRWRLETPSLTLRARHLVACDGAGSAVRKLLGVRESARKGHLYVAETPVGAADRGVEASLCDFDLRVADDGVEGYYWDFPVMAAGAPAVNRGIYHANFTARATLKRDLARSLAARGLDIDRVKLRPFSTRPLVRGAPLAREGVLLVGEAAGIDATTGEGIAQAILMGGIAATHLARAVGAGADAVGYAAAVRASPVGRHLLQSAWLSRRVYGAHGRAWRALLARDATARAAGARWYAGEPLGWLTQARLAAKLAAALAF